MGKFDTLKKEILKKSKAITWDEAKTEWFINNISFEPDGVCICGHRPITERIEIKNSETKKTTVIGNICACKFACDHLKITNSTTTSLKKLLLLGKNVGDISTTRVVERSQSDISTKVECSDDTFVVHRDLLNFFQKNSLLDIKDIEKYLLMSSGKGSRKKNHWKCKERMKLNRCMAFALKNMSEQPVCSTFRIPKNVKMNRKTWGCFWACPQFMSKHYCPNIIDTSIIAEYKHKHNGASIKKKRKRDQDNDNQDNDTQMEEQEEELPLPSKKLCA